MMSAWVFYKRNAHYVRVVGVTRGDDKTPLNDATVMVTMRYGPTPVPEVDGIVLPYVEGSAGDYQGIIGAGFDPRAGLNYILDIDITHPLLEAAHRELPVSVQVAATL